MNVVWLHQGVTVKEVVAALPEGEGRKVTTVATFLKILETKGFVTSHKHERSLVYCPKIALGEYQLIALRQMCRTLFDGRTDVFLERCLDEFKLKQQDLEVLIHQLDNAIERDG